MSNWFVLRVASRSELEAEKRIRALGFFAMAPYREVWHRIRRGRPRKRRYALFPSYAFVCLPEHGAGWQAIQGALNTDDRRVVYGLLPTGDHPATVRQEDVEYLASISDGKYQQDEGVRRLCVGDEVLIPSGPLKGFAGTILRLTRGRKATVSIKQMKFASTIEISLANLDST